MKILIVTQYFWPENFKINDLAVSMQKRGHEITVLTGIPNYPSGKFYKGYDFFNPKKEMYGDVKIVRTLLFPRLRANGFMLFLNYISFAFFSSLAVIFRLNRKFDLIFVYEISPITVGIPAIVLRKIRHIPIVFWVLDLWPESVFAASNLNHGIVGRWINPFVRVIYKNCDRILASSKGFIDSIVEKGVDPSIIDYVPNWAEDEYLIPVTKQNHEIDRLLPTAGLKIFFAGNIGESQDFESIVRSAELLREYKDIKWIILGDGRKRDWLLKQIKTLNLEDSILVPGKFPMDLMPYFFSRADAMLISLKNEYIFSLTVPAKLQTYMACRKPILAMINGETARIIEEACAGLVCDAGDYQKLAGNVLNIYHMSHKEKSALAENSFKYYMDNFEKEKILSLMETIFSKCLNNCK
jgi:colanic acid biosynthesis glycosyl transferase WcaI